MQEQLSSNPWMDGVRTTQEQLSSNPWMDGVRTTQEQLSSNPWMDGVRTTQEQLSCITHTVKGKCSTNVQKKLVNIKQEASAVGFK